MNIAILACKKIYSRGLLPININDEQEAVSFSEEADSMLLTIGRTLPARTHPVAEASLVAAEMLPVRRNRVRNRDQKIFG